MKIALLLLTTLFLSGCKIELVNQTPQENSNGFELIQLGQMRRDQFLLDKKTGQVWQSVCMVNSKGADCDYAPWVKMDVEDVNKSIDQIYDMAKLLKK